MTSTHEADLDVPSLWTAARKAHIFPALSASPLISIGQLCDSGCTAAFTAHDVSIKLDGQIILTGVRSPFTRLWSVDLPALPVPRTPTPSPIHLGPQQANTTRLSAGPSELVAFAHASLFSPALSTLSSALDKHLIPNFPGLSAASLWKYPPLSAPMIKGHLD
jgi:hypothetical protein